MSAKIGRNEPCSCGSGKKYKHCCEAKSGESNGASGGVGVALLVLILIIGGVASTFFFPIGGDSTADQANQSRANLGGQPISFPAPSPTSTGGTPQPPGPPPLGKVWSPEHGHWHNAGGVSAATGEAAPTGATTPAQQFTPQPPGAPPRGKVWSPEHGHWHDAP